MLAAAFAAPAAHAQAAPIKIGLLAPLTGPLASPGKDMVDGFKLFWEQAEHTGRRPQGRDRHRRHHLQSRPGAHPGAPRWCMQEKVHFLVGPLCGHEGPAVAQVSKETGVPLVMDAAGADNVTKWDRTPTVVRTAVSSSQIGHPFGEYLYKELGLRNVTFIGQDYTFGHEVTLGAMQDLHGRSAARSRRSSGTRSAPRTTAPTIASIPADSDGVSVAVVVGADRIRLFEAWFNFGMDKKHKIYGGYWMHQDVLPQMDDRAIGMIGNSLHYAAGLDTPENKAFTDAFAKKYKRLPSWFAESAYTAGPVDARPRSTRSSGNVEDREAFLKAMRTVAGQGAARAAEARRLRQSDPERLHHAHPEDQASGARRGAGQRADQDLRGGVAVLDLEAGRVPRSADRTSADAGTRTRAARPQYRPRRSFASR